VGLRANATGDMPRLHFAVTQPKVTIQPAGKRFTLPQPTALLVCVVCRVSCVSCVCRVSCVCVVCVVCVCVCRVCVCSVCSVCVCVSCVCRVCVCVCGLLTIADRESDQTSPVQVSVGVGRVAEVDANATSLLSAIICPGKVAPPPTSLSQPSPSSSMNPISSRAKPTNRELERGEQRQCWCSIRS
jgi:hypothetical protein